MYRSVTKVIDTSRVLRKCQVSIKKKNSLFLNPKYQRAYSPYRYLYILVLLTEKISLKSERLCYSRDFIAELGEKIYDLLFIRVLGIIRARVWISALLWVVCFKGSSWTIISTGFWERIMLCSVIRKQHHRSIRFHLKFFHVFSKSRLPAKKALLYFFHQKSYHFYCYWRKLSPLDRKMIKLLTFDNLFPPLRHVV